MYHIYKYTTVLSYLTLILHTGPVGGGNAPKAGLQPAVKLY